MDRSILEAAIIGYQHQIAQAQAAVVDIQKQLGHRGPGRPRGVTAPAESSEATPIKRRTMSAAARKRIADAQKKRWAAYNKAKAAA
jgi:hypothetical protein